jgi:hypothetical protein
MDIFKSIISFILALLSMSIFTYILYKHDKRLKNNKALINYLEKKKGE